MTRRIHDLSCADVRSHMQSRACSRIHIPAKNFTVFHRFSAAYAIAGENEGSDRICHRLSPGRRSDGLGAYCDAFLVRRTRAQSAFTCRHAHAPAFTSTPILANSVVRSLILADFGVRILLHSSSAEFASALSSSRQKNRRRANRIACTFWNDLLGGRTPFTATDIKGFCKNELE